MTTCKACKCTCREVFEHNGKCIICTRLDSHDLIIGKTTDVLHKVTELITAFNHYMAR